MTPMVKKLLMDKKPIIPQNLKPNVLAWWDARERGQVFYGLNQLLTNGNFVNTTGWAIFLGIDTLSAINNTLTFTGNNTSGTVQIYKDTTTPITTGKKVYAKCRVRTLQSGISNFQLKVRGSSSGVTGSVDTVLSDPAANQWYTIYAVIPLSASMTGNIRIALSVAASSGNLSQTIEVQNIILCDLSAPMGAGNEPTATEMDAILVADGNQYWEGTRQVLCNPDNKYFWKDYSGNGRHMKLNNFAYSGASGWQSPYGLATDGVDDLAKYAATSINPANTDFSMVVVSAKKSALSHLVYASQGVAAHAMYLYDNGAGVITLSVNDSVSGVENITANLTKTINMIVGTYSQADKKGRLYINGDFIIESSALTNGLKNITHIKFGASSPEATFSVVKNFMLSVLPGKVISPVEAKQLYDNNKRRLGI